LLAGYCGILAISGNLFPISFEKWSGKFKGMPKKYFDDCLETLLKVLISYLYSFTFTLAVKTII
jgi:hypothetical protein